MALVSLYAPDSVPKDFLKLADGQLVSLVPAAPSPADPFALFDRSSTTTTCACGTRNGLAVRDRTVLSNNKLPMGFPLYVLPPDCTFEETVTIVTWLTRFRFKTFRHCVEEGWFYRTLESEPVFRVSSSRDDDDDDEKCCQSFTLDRDPVFMLKTIVLSPFGKGPTLESVLIK